MADARLEVTDALGRRIVPISKAVFEIGRRETNDLRLAGSEVSRDHAEIAAGDKAFVIRDRNSRYGTYVNDQQVTEHTLSHGDVIRPGRRAGRRPPRLATCGRLPRFSMGCARSAAAVCSTTSWRWCWIRQST